MKYKLGKILLSGLVCITSLSWAADSSLTPQSIFENMQQQETRITDLRFSLKQVIALKALKERQIVKGTIIYKKPDLLYVEYTSPTQQMVIANKDDLVMYVLADGKWQENMRQKVSTLIGKQWKSDFGLWSVNDLTKNYETKAISEGGKEVLLLEPKDKTYRFKMKIFVDTSTWLPVKTIWEDDNQLITSELLNVKINTGVRDELFKFK
ncbi:MAG: outer membrane lipoprotein carrier protein LolA [Elusimicrobia bacterium]|nr:outer membrane lipoprotein carrier protein LolA [Elusimicrobiota bacterium]